jgi:hypothetical protein
MEQHHAGSKQSFIPVSCTAYSSILEVAAACSSQTSSFTALYGIISQMTDPFIGSAMRISNPVYLNYV